MDYTLMDVSTGLWGAYEGMQAFAHNRAMFDDAMDRMYFWMTVLSEKAKINGDG